MKTCNLETRRRLALIYIVVGAILLAVSFFGFTAADDFRSGLLNGMGTSLLVCGVVLLLRTERTRRDSEKAAEYEVNAADERLRFIAERARSNTFVIGVVAELVAMLLAYFVFSAREVGLALNIAVCGQMVLYILLYWVYNKKY